ncbi:hypothetical protein L3Y34_011805 [Caenorhabditis briggsae]|uniref:Uncharacterized protein n=1 Tax=Caenorhabditis briggsae TaxID=6238 RepID=A0AAE8ZMH3_CAEBR|nr:hypothetical protein L3Y34_011805 [Caenorhabditis briggsae]
MEPILEVPNVLPAYIIWTVVLVTSALIGWFSQKNHVFKRFRRSEKVVVPQDLETGRVPPRTFILGGSQ